jgi:hypothetical protein
MRLLALLISLFIVGETFGYEHFRAPNKQFEAYTTANYADGTGMKLFLRPAGSRDIGVRLWENSRWIDAKWSPDSRFLAVIDHLDGHMADVYIFGVSADATPTLFYHTPNLRTYDVQWDVVGWKLKTRSVILKKEVRFGISRQTVVAHIGTTAMKPPDQT